LEANCLAIGRKIKNNLENGEKYVGTTKTTYQNLMLRVLKIEK
jgi:hypothetical protein